MALYDFVAPFYDPLLQRFFRPFRQHAFDFFPAEPKSTVLDLACGTGQNFPLIASHIGTHGKIIGVDNSWLMLRGARKRAKLIRVEHASVFLYDATQLSTAVLKANSGAPAVDYVVCTYGFTAMREWQTAFHRAYGLLKPGGGFLIHDIHAEKKTFYSGMVENVTRCDFSRKTWEPLQRVCADFHMEYLEPAKNIFGGRLFVAYGTKH